jgi:dolichol-phosphate mannosyltransferase
MDADFSHDPRHVPELLDAATHNDLVLGSRYVAGGGTQNWGIGRKIVSKGGSLYARAVLGVRVRDLTGGFKCFRRETLERIDLASVRSEGYSFQIELTDRALALGLRVVEVPIIFVDRRVGKSKMSRQIFLEAASMVFRLRMDRRKFLKRVRGK